MKSINVKSDPLVWVHQYANYLNRLVDKFRKYEEVSYLTLDQANDLIGCLPKGKIMKEPESCRTLWTVYQ